MSNGNGHRWSKFWWQDWQNEIGLRVCSLAARGLWMEMLCIAHEGQPAGYLTRHNGGALSTKNLALLVGAAEREVKKLLAELEDAGVFSRTEDGVIYCRRMVREEAADASAREAWRAHGSNGGNPNIIRGTVAKEERQRPYRRSDAPQKTERIFQRDGGRCHWCQEPLVRDNPRHPLYFHVDHIVAVRDGGGTEEANLVAACQRCNMKRARHDTTSDSPPPEPAKPNGTDPYIPAYKPPGTLSDSNPTEIPTATLRTFRQQGSDDSDSNPPRARDREQKLEAEAERTPRSPPRGARSRVSKNAFHDLARAMDAEAATTIDASPADVVEFNAFFQQRKGLANG